MFVFAPVLPPAMQRRQWRIWLFGRHWFCRLMVSQINVQLISQLVANSSLGLSLPFLFHFFLLLRNIISHQVDEGRRNEMEIHPFISILVTLKSLDREMKRLQCSHQMYLMIIRTHCSLFPITRGSHLTLQSPLGWAHPLLESQLKCLCSWCPCQDLWSNSSFESQFWTPSFMIGNSPRVSTF